MEAKLFIVCFGRKTTFAINAIERTNLYIGGQKINSQRNSQAAAFYRAKYYFIEQKCCHKGSKDNMILKPL